MPAATALAAAAAFVALAVWVTAGERPGWDVDLVARALEARHGTLADALIELARATAWLVPTFFSIAYGLWLLLERRVHDAVLFALAAGGGGILVAVLKSIVRAARPTLAEPLGPASGFSFPSGHALSSLAILLGVLVTLHSRRARLLVALGGGALVVAIGASRVILGAHYGSDVLAGWCAAIAWVSALVAIDRVFVARRLRPGAGRVSASRR